METQSLDPRIALAVQMACAAPGGDINTAFSTALQTIKSAERDISSIGPTTQVPAVPVKKSVTEDYIICLEDGKKLKMLKRHLATTYNMTPEQYRVKWGLPIDYPMVAPNYAEKRSSLAKSIGLGTRKATVVSIQEYEQAQDATA